MLAIGYGRAFGRRRRVEVPHPQSAQLARRTESAAARDGIDGEARIVDQCACELQSDARREIVDRDSCRLPERARQTSWTHARASRELAQCEPPLRILNQLILHSMNAWM